MIVKTQLLQTLGSSIRGNSHKPVEIPHLEFPIPTSNLLQFFKN